MNLAQLIAAKKAEILALKSRVETGDADATEKAAVLIAELEELEAKKAKADAFEATVARIGSDNAGSKGAGESRSKDGTIGERAARAVKSAGISRERRGSVTVGLRKEGEATTAGPNVLPTGDAAALAQETRSELAMQPRRPLTVAALFAQETTDKDAVTYYVESATVTGGPGMVSEGGKYPMVQFGEPQKKTDAIKKIGCIYKDTDELLSDAPRLAQSIDGRAMYLMDIKEEEQLLNGDGTGNNICGLLSTSGLQTGSWTDIESLVKKIKNAKVLVKKATPGFRADGLLINDEDWDELTNLQDSNKQFMAGGPFYGQYGNGGSTVEEPPLWGLRVVPTQAIERGTVVVGAFYLGGSVVRNGGRTVDVTNSDEDDFQNGLVAFRPSERAMLAVRYPAAFVKLSKTGS